MKGFGPISFFDYCETVFHFLILKNKININQFFLNLLLKNEEPSATIEIGQMHYILNEKFNNKVKKYKSI